MNENKRHHSKNWTCEAFMLFQNSNNDSCFFFSCSQFCFPLQLSLHRIFMNLSFHFVIKINWKFLHTRRTAMSPSVVRSSQKFRHCFWKSDEQHRKKTLNKWDMSSMEKNSSGEEHWDMNVSVAVPTWIITYHPNIWAKQFVKKFYINSSFRFHGIFHWKGFLFE